MDEWKDYGWYENSSSKGWTDGEIYDWYENSSPNRWTDGEIYGWYENSSPKGWTDGELHGWYENNSPKGWMAQKITCQKDGRMDSYMFGKKITHPRDGQHTNNSLKGGRMESYGRHENYSPKDGELNGRHESFYLYLHFTSFFIFTPLKMRVKLRN